MGNVAQMRGDLDEAMRLYRESYELTIQIGLPDGQATQLGNMGFVARLRGDIDGARAFWEQSLALFSEIGAQPMIEKIQSLLGALPPDTK